MTHWSLTWSWSLVSCAFMLDFVIWIYGKVVFTFGVKEVQLTQSWKPWIWE